eukprot:352026-Chlamydomonas_euryale.AAC.5
MATSAPTLNRKRGSPRMRSRKNGIVRHSQPVKTKPCARCTVEEVWKVWTGSAVREGAGGAGTVGGEGVQDAHCRQRGWCGQEAMQPQTVWTVWTACTEGTGCGKRVGRAGRPAHSVDGVEKSRYTSGGWT